MDTQSHNPFTQDTIASFPNHTNEELKEKLELAEKTYPVWKSTPLEHRVELLHKLADLLDSKKHAIASLITAEMGKLLSEAEGEVTKCALVCRYYADHAKEFLTPKPTQVDAFEAYVQYQPIGAVFAVMPWNFPFWQVFRFAAPNIVAGNVGILKHASNVSGCSLLIEDLFKEAGFEEGVFQSVIINSDQTELIIEHPIVQGITLTGSEKAGSIVSSLASKHLKKSVLELGGSDPLIVLPDADIDKAVDIAFKSRYQNAGQSCIAAKRWIIHKDVVDSFTEKMLAKVKTLKLGDPMLKETTLAPVARPDLAETLEKQIQDSIKVGAELLYGGNRNDTEFEATLLKADHLDMPICSEETFGPCGVIITADSEEDAIVKANQTPFGLGGSVWTKDLKKGKQIASQINAGAVFVNGLVRSDPHTPFGGIGISGFGRELSIEGFHEFLNVKTVVIDE